MGIFRVHPRGGLEDHAMRMAAELKARGHRVVLHATGCIDAPGLETVRLDRAVRPPTNHGRMRAFARDFAHTVAAESYDCIVGFQPMPGLDVLFIADHLRDHGEVPALKRLLPRFRAFRTLERSAFAAPQGPRVLGLTRTQMDAFARRYPASAGCISVLPPTIAPSRLRADLRTPENCLHMRERYSVPQGSALWLWAGLQPRNKGLDRALKALARMPEAVLVVAGLDPATLRMAGMVRMAGRLGVSERVRFAGFLSSDAMSLHFATADVLVHPARVDVTGAVILEAIINGLPVVATACCGFAPHVVVSGAGRVVPDDPDEAVLTAALADATDPENQPRLSRLGLAYGASADLYSGLAAACDAIEAAAEAKAVSRLTTTGAPASLLDHAAGREAWSR